MKNTELVLSALKRLKPQKADDFIVPGIFSGKRGKKLQVNPAKYYSDRIQELFDLAATLGPPNMKHQPDSAVIYNVFLRYSFAYAEEPGVNVLELTPSGFRRTGTFLKLIAALPYLHSLGINTIYLLPITSTGRTNRKGNLGSPYSIRNPYKLDSLLAEPALGLSAETEFKAFMECAHSIGMRVILEFVFRTASLDSEWAVEHPDWFYWIKDETENRESDSMDETKYGNPIFTPEELELIKTKILADDFKKLPPPHEAYKELFAEAPRRAELDGDQVIGTGPAGERLRIPFAFADWPPDDVQPPWSDVTYLRLYDHPRFNYIAYNTVRMYDYSLAQPANRIKALWETISDIIPFYIKQYDIDGIMLDMGHALPLPLRREIVKKARKVKKNFTFWEENFSLSEHSAEEGYSAVVGYLPFDLHVWWKVRHIIDMLSGEGSPIAFFGTGENHNTPRTASRPGGVAFARFAFALSTLLPSLPFIHSGMEIFEHSPINTGLGFSNEEIEQWPSERLPLFSAGSMNWDSEQTMVETIVKILAVRRRNFVLEENFNPETIIPLETENEFVFAFLRKFSNGRTVFFAASMAEGEAWANIHLDSKKEKISDSLTGKEFVILNSVLAHNFNSWEFIVAE